MDKKLAQFAIVIVAAGHNPTIMNPDFLKNQKIIGEGWELAEPPITTLPFASVRYMNGISITVEQNKMQVADDRVSNPLESGIIDIVKKYVLVVPHVKYTAVGINLNAFVELDNASDYLISKFLRDGAWNIGENQLSGLALKLIYPVPGGRLIFSLDSGHIKSETDGKPCEKSVLLGFGNFHRDMGSSEQHLSEQVSNCLDNIESDWRKFYQIFSSLLPS